jgi:hypothetical protein
MGQQKNYGVPDTIETDQFQLNQTLHANFSRSNSLLENSNNENDRRYSQNTITTTTLDLKTFLLFFQKKYHRH